MKGKFLLLCIFSSIHLFAQNDTTVVDISKEIDNKTKNPDEQQALKVFYGQRLINTNTVEVLRKGVMEFRVVHNFGDFAGTFGGLKNFFGLDAATDVRIGFQLGVAKNLNLIAARSKGTISPLKLWELGIKNQLMHQQLHDPRHPLSITWFANVVTSSEKADTFSNVIRENDFSNFGDRLSEVLQLMIAKKIGSVSLQLHPTFVHRNFVIPGDDNSIFALGGGIRLPITKSFVLIADYFHPFRSKSSKDFYAARGKHYYDPFGVGFEILTWGHVFHFNFTNSYEILENKLIPTTTTRWGKGEFRWGFMLSRNFTLFNKAGGK